MHSLGMNQRAGNWSTIIVNEARRLGWPVWNRGHIENMDGLSEEGKHILFCEWKNPKFSTFFE